MREMVLPLIKYLDVHRKLFSNTPHDYLAVGRSDSIVDEYDEKVADLERRNASFNQKLGRMKESIHSFLNLLIF